MSDQAHAVCRIAQQAGGWPASEHGQTLLELLFAVACMAVVSGIAVASIGRTIERSRGLAAARYLAARMTLARTQAVTWESAVGSSSSWARPAFASFGHRPLRRTATPTQSGSSGQ